MRSGRAASTGTGTTTSSFRRTPFVNGAQRKVASLQDRAISGAGPFGFRSDSEMARRAAPPVITTLVLVVVCLVSGNALIAQSHVDSLLDGSSLEDLWVHVNERDWEDLH